MNSVDDVDSFRLKIFFEALEKEVAPFDFKDKVVFTEQSFKCAKTIYTKKMIS